MFIQEIASKRTAREKSQLRTEYGVTTVPNPLLLLPVDLHRYLLEASYVLFFKILLS